MSKVISFYLNNYYFMMAAVRLSCKFCLTYIQGDGLVTLNYKILDKLDILQIYLDQSAKESNFLCKKCERQIENAYNFKILLANSIELSGSHDIIQNTPNTSTDKMSTEKIICHLCKNSVDKLSTISLKKLLKDDGMVEVFQGHIQEVDLENIEENSVVCESCQKSLVNFWTVVELWLRTDYCNDDIGSVEMLEVKKENLDRLVEGAFVDSPCTFEVSDSLGNNLNTKKAKSEKRQLINDDASESGNKKIKTETSESGESVSLTCKGVKKEVTEEHEEAKMEELQLKNEEIIIKDEDRLLVRSKLLPFLLQVRPHENKNNNKGLDDVEVYECNVCSYVTKYKDTWKAHLLSHKSLDEVKLYTCKECSFITKNKYNLKNHLLLHKSLDEVKVYKCSECSYVTKYKNYLKCHLLLHKSLDEVQVYKCKECSFVTKYRISFNNHLLTHKSLDEVKLYSCQRCSFETKYKQNLTRHVLTHKSLDEVELYKCK